MNRKISSATKALRFHIPASILAILWLIPIALVFATSFREAGDLARNGVGSIPTSFTLANYLEAWRSAGLFQALANSFAVTVPAVALSIGLASLAAYALSRYEIRYGRQILLVMLAGNLLPVQLTLVPVSRLSQWLGIYDQLTAIVLVQVAFGLGFYTFVLYGFMRSIPFEVQEAAVIDGAGPLRVFWYVILPLARPSLAALSALSFTWIFNDLLWSLALLQTQSKLPVTAAVLSLNGQFVTSWSVVAAGTVVAALPPVIVFAMFQRYFVSGLTLGAVK